MHWQPQDAKQRFGELVRRALGEGPQIVTRHGRDAVVVVSLEEFRRVTGGQPFKEFLLQDPDWPELELKQSKAPSRKVEL